MKHVFIADDGKIKLEDIRNTVRRVFPEAGIHTFTCGKDLCRCVCRDFYNYIQDDPNNYLVITDMQMPWVVGDGVRSDCGYIVLKDMQAHELRCPAIIVSPDSVDKSIAEQSYDCFASSLIYTCGIPQDDLYKYIIDNWNYEHSDVQ